MHPCRRGLGTVVRAATIGGAALLLWSGSPVAPPPLSAASSIKQMMVGGEARAAVEMSSLGVGRRRIYEKRQTYIPSHVVVKFDAAESPLAMRDAMDAVQAERVIRPSYADFVYLDLPDGVDAVEAAAALQGVPGVVYAEPDYIAYPLYRPNDPLYQYQWNLQKLDMERVWDINAGAENSVIVAVLDTGAAFTSAGQFAQAPDFASTRFVRPYDFVWDDAEPFDFDGHGTHVTGTVAQSTNNTVGVAGFAFNVSVMPVKVLFTDWDETWRAPYPFGSSTVSRGIRYAVDNGAKVINMSLGAFGPNTATLDALRYAVGRGVFVAVSAGNDGDGLNRESWPASYARDIDGVVAVAAVDFNLRHAYYSTHRNYVELAAPGGDTRVDLNRDGYVDGVLQQTLDDAFVDAGIFNRFGYFFFQGTSMSSPHVAALAALLIDQGVTSPAAIEAAMKMFADDAAPAGRDEFTGHGVINPRKTLRGLGLAR